jgi:hypothetical protein
MSNFVTSSALVKDRVSQKSFSVCWQDWYSFVHPGVFVHVDSLVGLLQTQRKLASLSHIRRYTPSQSQSIQSPRLSIHYPVAWFGSPHSFTRQRMLLPPPLWVQGGSHTRLRGGGAQFRRWDRHSGTLGIYTVLYLYNPSVYDPQYTPLRGPPLLFH